MQAIKLDEIRIRVKARQIFSFQDVLLLLACRDDRRKVLQLAEEIGAPKPAITRGIDNFAGMEPPFLTRVVDLDDKRSPWIVITTAGKKFLARMIVDV